MQSDQKHLGAINAMFRAVDTGGARALLKTARYKEELAEMTPSQSAGIALLDPPPAQETLIPEMSFGQNWTSAQENQARQLYNVYIQSLR